MIKPMMNRISGSTVASGSFWVFTQTASSQFIRLAANLVLTRLLVPEYFGLMTLIITIEAFFHMISDIGLTPSIVNSKRDKESAFMQTAWTIQIIRSASISLMVIISAYPLSIIYNEPMLFSLLCFMSLCTFLQGFSSIAMILEQKYLRQKRLAITDILSQLASTLLIILLAFLYQSVWVLIAGYFIRIICVLVASYVFFSPHYSRFRLEKAAVHEIVHFGKWLIIASTFGYFAARGGALIMGAFLSMNEFGIYVIAATFASLMEMVSNRLANTILQPRYRQLIVAEDNYGKLYRLRFLFNLAFIFPTIFLAVWGGWIITFLYDPRYEEAGWILQILAIGRIANIFTHHSQPILISLGDSRRIMINQMFNAFIVIASLLLGNYLAGFKGMIILHSLSTFPAYFLLGSALKKHNVKIFFKDLPLMLSSCALIFLVWAAVDATALSVLKDFFFGL